MVGLVRVVFSICCYVIVVVVCLLGCLCLCCVGFVV